MNWEEVILEYVRGRPRVRDFGGQLGWLPSELRMELARFYLEPTFEVFFVNSKESLNGSQRFVNIIVRSGNFRSVCEVDLATLLSLEGVAAELPDRVKRRSHNLLPMHQFQVCIDGQDLWFLDYSTEARLLLSDHVVPRLIELINTVESLRAAYASRSSL